MQIQYELLSKETLQQRINKIALPIDAQSMNVPVYQGFAYFSPEDFSDGTSEKGTRFVIATDVNTDEIVGVMKTKRYHAYEHYYVSEEDKDFEDNYIAIRYVNTKKGWKQKGIAKGLYQKLGESLKTDENVVGSPLTTEGKRAQLTKIKKELLVGINLYANLYEFEEENEIW